MQSIWFQRICAFFLMFGISLGFQHVTYAKENQELTILVPNFPPYTYQDNRQITGIGIELATEIFQIAGLKVNYQLMPNYGKVVHEASLDKGDGFLLASQNTERDKIAIFSEPLLINRWCWYTLKETQFVPDYVNFKNLAKVSTHLNTNTHKWLVAQNYSVEPVTNINVLPELLLKKRVDAVFIAELVFEQALKQGGYSFELFDKFIEVEKSFGIYINKTYLEKHPDTLSVINNAIVESGLPRNEALAGL